MGVPSCSTSAPSGLTLPAPVLNGALTGTGVSTDGTMAGSSATKVPSQSAVVTYVASQIKAIPVALISRKTANNSGTALAWTGLSGYEAYEIVCVGLNATVGDLGVIQIGTGPTPTYQTSGYGSGFLSNSLGTQLTNSGITVTATNGIALNYAGYDGRFASIGPGYNFDIKLLNASGTVSGEYVEFTPVISGGIFDNFSDQFWAQIGGAYKTVGTVVTAVRVIDTTGNNLTTGYCDLLGWSY
jgi:hypothetical protein